jgi:hypothetical protein
MPGDGGGRHGGEDHRGKGGDSEIAQEDFQGKQDPRDGGVEGGGDPGGGPAPHHGLLVRPCNVEYLRHGGTERGADLYDGTLPPHRPARSDTDGGGQDLGRGHPFPDHPVSKGHRFHDFRYTVPFGLAGCKGHDQTDDEPPEAGNSDDNVPGRAWEKVRISPALPVEEILGPFDQKTKKDGPVSAQKRR